MIELLFDKSITLFLFIDTYTISILFSILSFALLVSEHDKDLIHLRNSKNGSIEDYIQEKIYSKRLENISEEELRTLIKIEKENNFDKKHKKRIQELRESISFFYEKDVKNEKKLRIAYFKKSGFITLILIMLLMKRYLYNNLESISYDLYHWSQKLYAILLSFLFYYFIFFFISVLIYNKYINIKKTSQ